MESFSERPRIMAPTREQANELIGRQIELAKEQRGGPPVPEEKIIDTLI